MSTTTNTDDVIEDVMVLIYEVVCAPDGTGHMHTFNVSISKPLSEARLLDRDGEAIRDEVWRRVEKVVLRDKMNVTPTSFEWIRERLIKPKG